MDVGLLGELETKPRTATLLGRTAFGNLLTIE